MPRTVSTDVTPISALDLNFAGSGCEAMVAFGVFEHCLGLATLAPSTRPFWCPYRSLLSSPHHNTVCFTSLHIPQHSSVLSYLPVPQRKSQSLILTYPLFSGVRSHHKPDSVDQTQN